MAQWNRLLTPVDCCKQWCEFWIFKKSPDFWFKSGVFPPKKKTGRIFPKNRWLRNSQKKRSVLIQNKERYLLLLPFQFQFKNKLLDYSQMLTLKRISKIDLELTQKTKKSNQTVLLCWFEKIAGAFALSNPNHNFKSSVLFLYIKINWIKKRAQFST